MRVRVQRDAGKETLVSIRVQFELKCRLGAEVAATDAGLTAFAQVNGAFNP